MNDITLQLQDSKDNLVKELEDLKKIDLDGAIAFRNTVLSWKQRINFETDTMNNYIKDFIDKCPHPSKFLVEHFSGEYITIDIRVCKLCGLQESHPFDKLRHYGTLQTVSFDEAMKIRLQVTKDKIIGDSV